MRVLILGGTGFIGPAFVQAAVDRGHDVTIFNRGKSQADLPASVKRLIGDRNVALNSLKNCDWDAVFEMSTYLPSWVRRLGESLGTRVKHYTFISSAMTYKFPGATDESSKLIPYSAPLDPYQVTSLGAGQTYGPLKVFCEQEAEKQFPGKTLVLRAGNIVGPRDAVGALTYLAVRMDKGGEVLAAGDPLAPVQLIDVRDMAEWAVRMAEQGRAGIFNTTGPAMSLSWAELLGGVRAGFSVPTRLTWVPMEWVMEQRISPFSALLFWPAEFGVTGFHRLSNDKAVASGMTFRPLQDTVRETLAWYKSLSHERQREVLLKVDESTHSLEDVLAREAQLLAKWHDREARSHR